MKRRLPPRALDRLGRIAGTPDEPPSRETIGKYRLIRKLGAGAMGEVFEAEDTDLRRRVALKLLRDFSTPSETVRQRFRREALALSRLAHPSVVRIYDAGEQDGRLFLAMELVTGRPLSDLLRDRTRPLRNLVVLLVKAAQGTAAAHEAGIVHRDLKPGNIFVDERGEPRVGDFGLAHVADSSSDLTRTGALVGTPMYMAPEQALGDPRRISARTDVYALGAILYEMLTGRPPFAGTTSIEIIGKILNGPPLPPRQVDGRIPQDLETICMKALEPSPDRRYRGAKELADDLQRWLDDESILARPPGTAARAARWIRRHRTWTVGLAGAALAGLLTAGSWVQRSLERRRAVDAQLEIGRAALVKRDRLAAERRRLLQEEAALAARIPPNAGEPEKEPLWAARRRLREVEQQLRERRDEILLAFTATLALDPDEPQARGTLARLHVEECEESERRGDEAGMRFHERLARLYDPTGEWTARLDREAVLHVESRPPGAEAELYRYEEGMDSRLTTVPVRRLPAGPASLPPGSYVVVLTLEGRRPARYPVLLRRGDRHVRTVNLHTEQEIGAAFVHVPGGPFVAGGGTGDDGEIPRRDAQTEDFFIGRHEVTFGEYFEFINALRRERGVAEAQKRVPRNLPEGGWLVVLDPAADLDAGERIARMPVTGISLRDAEAYCAWRTQTALGSREVIRLPTGDEWERAARGADGRLFPWGNHFDWSFANGFPSTASAKGPVSVDAFPADESPFGARGMAGNVSEWCDDWEEPGVMARVHGSSWSSGVRSEFRCAMRTGASPEIVRPFVGFRVAKTFRR